jgi:hypothetical protein
MNTPMISQLKSSHLSHATENGNFRIMMGPNKQAAVQQRCENESGGGIGLEGMFKFFAQNVRSSEFGILMVSPPHILVSRISTNDCQ